MKILAIHISMFALLLVGCNEEEVNALTGKNEDLQKKNTELTKESEDKQKQLEELGVKLTSQKTAYDGQIKELKGQGEKLDVENANLTDQLKLATDELAKLKEESAAQKKAAEEANFKKKSLIADAVNYFKVKEDISGVSSNAFVKNGIRFDQVVTNLYTDFKYDPATKNLSFRSIEQYAIATSSAKYPEEIKIQTNGSRYFRNYRLNLTTCNSLISTQTPTRFPIKTPDLLEVKIVGDCEFKTTNKVKNVKHKGRGVDYDLNSELHLNTEELKDYDAKEFELVKNAEISFAIEANEAKAFKEVLSDLLKGHGINPSKY